MIYLASPYSDEDPTVRQVRFMAVCKIAAKLMRNGIFIFSPIAHTHPIAMAGELPTGWEFWEEFDRQHISVCEAVWVLKLPGWKESKGVTAEIKIAELLKKPVFFIDPAAFVD